MTIKNLAAALCLFVLFGGRADAHAKKKVLFVMSGVDYVTGKDGAKHTTGYWVEEFVVPYRKLKKNGLDIVIATPGGVVPKADPMSFEQANWKTPKELQEAKDLVAAAPELKKPVELASLKEADLAAFSAVFYPGGHAPMEDLAKDPDSGRILRFFHEKRMPTALVCHGPIALLSAKQESVWPYAGYKMTVFSNSEEKQSHLASYLTYSVEDELKSSGGVFEGGKDWQPTVVEDRELITGQNPMSAALVADAIVKRVKAQPRGKAKARSH